MAGRITKALARPEAAGFRVSYTHETVWGAWDSGSPTSVRVDGDWLIIGMDLDGMIRAKVRKLRARKRRIERARIRRSGA